MFSEDPWQCEAENKQFIKSKKISMTVFNADMDISDKEIKHYKLVHFVRRCRINDHAEFT